MDKLRTLVTRFIKRLSPEERERVRILTKKGVKVGVKYADTEGLDLNQFNSELVKIFRE